ncbi:MAG: hypothetical protein JWM53_5921, partial [bacterium]|nr:hypothetical protein [bacterium]
TQIVTSPRRNGAFAVGSDRLFWVAPSFHAPDNGVFRAPKSGGDVVAVASFAWGYTGAGAVTDGEVLFYSVSGNIDQEAGVLYRMMPDGTSALWSDYAGCSLGVSNQLASDERELFYVEFDNPRCATPQQTHVRAVAKSGGPSRLVATASRIVQLRVDGGYAYFIDDVAATVSRVATAGGGAIEPLLTGGLTQPTLLAVDGSTLLIGDSGRVLRVPATGGAATTIWTHPPDGAGNLTALVAGGGRVWVGWDDRLGVFSSDGSGFVTLGSVKVDALALDERHLYVSAGDAYRICR